MSAPHETAPRRRFAGLSRLSFSTTPQAPPPESPHTPAEPLRTGSLPPPAPAAPAKPAYHRSKTRPPPEIPRPPNAWILYRSAKLREVLSRDANPPSSSSSAKPAPAGGPVKLGPQQHLSKQIAAQWANESKEVKEWYFRLAEEKLKQHRLEHPDYKYQPRFTRKAKERGESDGAAAPAAASPATSVASKRTSMSAAFSASLGSADVSALDAQTPRSPRKAPRSSLDLAKNQRKGSSRPYPAMSPRNSLVDVGHVDLVPRLTAPPPPPSAMMPPTLCSPHRRRAYTIGKLDQWNGMAHSVSSGPPFEPPRAVPTPRNLSAYAGLGLTPFLPPQPQFNQPPLLPPPAHQTAQTNPLRPDLYDQAFAHQSPTTVDPMLLCRPYDSPSPRTPPPAPPPSERSLSGSPQKLPKERSNQSRPPGLGTLRESEPQLGVSPRRRAAPAVAAPSAPTIAAPRPKRGTPRRTNGTGSSGVRASDRPSLASEPHLFGLASPTQRNRHSQAAEQVEIPPLVPVIEPGVAFELQPDEGRAAMLLLADDPTLKENVPLPVSGSQSFAGGNAQLYQFPHDAAFEQVLISLGLIQPAPEADATAASGSGGSTEQQQQQSTPPQRSPPPPGMHSGAESQPRPRDAPPPGIAPRGSIHGPSSSWQPLNSQAQNVTASDAWSVDPFQTVPTSANAITAAPTSVFLPPPAASPPPPYQQHFDSGGPPSAQPHPSGFHLWGVPAPSHLGCEEPQSAATDSSFGDFDRPPAPPPSESSQVESAATPFPAVRQATHRRVRSSVTVSGSPSKLGGSNVNFSRPLTQAQPASLSLDPFELGPGLVDSVLSAALDETWEHELGVQPDDQSASANAEGHNEAFGAGHRRALTLEMALNGEAFNGWAYAKEAQRHTHVDCDAQLQGGNQASDEPNPLDDHDMSLEDAEMIVSSLQSSRRVEPTDPPQLLSDQQPAQLDSGVSFGEATMEAMLGGAASSQDGFPWSSSHVVPSHSGDHSMASVSEEAEDTSCVTKTTTTTATGGSDGPSRIKLNGEFTEEELLASLEEMRRRRREGAEGRT